MRCEISCGRQDKEKASFDPIIRLLQPVEAFRSSFLMVRLSGSFWSHKDGFRHVKHFSFSCRLPSELMHLPICTRAWRNKIIQLWWYYVRQEIVQQKILTIWIKMATPHSNEHHHALGNLLDEWHDLPLNVEASSKPRGLCNRQAGAAARGSSARFMQLHYVGHVKPKIDIKAYSLLQPSY